MAGNLVFGTLAGYGLAKFRFRGDRFVLLLILSTLMLPLEVTLVPTFLVVHAVRAGSTPIRASSAPLLIDAFGVFLMRQSIISIPTDYIEAARIDGAGELRILLQVILPQCKPALAILAIFSFRDSWDQYLWPLTVVSVDQLRTYPLGLVQFGEDYGNPPTEQMAIAVLATIPVFLLFCVLQRSVRGLRPERPEMSGNSRSEPTWRRFDRSGASGAGIAPLFAAWTAAISASTASSPARPAPATPARCRRCSRARSTSSTRSAPS